MLGCMGVCLLLYNAFLSKFFILACSVAAAQLLAMLALQWLAFLLFLEIVLAITAVSYLILLIILCFSSC